jgi:prepilin-type N-terminal cleavage/methylation domain-containing protein
LGARKEAEANTTAIKDGRVWGRAHIGATTSSFSGSKKPGCAHGSAGFTLIELLVVMAIIALLAALLLPSLATAKSKGKLVGCLNNLNQLAVAQTMYAADNAGRLPDNLPVKAAQPSLGTNCWVKGDMTIPAEATNQVLLQEGELFPYASHVSTYHCPADPSMVNGVARVRSYSMNGWMGSRYMAGQYDQTVFRTFLRDTELGAAGASLLWMLIEEHEASIDDAWFLVTMDDSRPFASYPATRHNHDYSLTFADGHVQAIKLRDPQSQRLGVAGLQVNALNADWIRLKQATTVR